MYQHNLAFADEYNRKKSANAALVPFVEAPKGFSTTSGSVVVVADFALVTELVRTLAIVVLISGSDPDLCRSAFWRS